jgi:hypothetical protein
MQFHLFMHALRKPFNRHNRLPIRPFGGIDARDHRLAIHKDGTRAALGFFTANLCPCEAQSLTEESREGLARDGVESMFDAINCKGELICHDLFPKVLGS